MRQILLKISLDSEVLVSFEGVCKFGSMQASLLHVKSQARYLGGGEVFVIEEGGVLIDIYSGNL